MKSNQSEWNGEQQRATRPLLRWCVLPLLMVAVVVGCKQEPKVTADSNPVGSYTLVSVDGNKVPCTVQHEGHNVAVKSGTFIINADGTCSSKSVFSVPPGGDVNRVVKATYTRESSNLTMRWEGAGTTTGTVEGDMFTMNNEGMVFAYRK
jgi:hypothetical protein